MIKPSYIINTQDETASLNLYNLGELLTTYSYASDVITLQERSDTDILSPDQFKDNVESIRNWIVLIKRILEPSRSIKQLFNIEIKKSSSKIEGTYSFMGTKVTDCEYEVGPNHILFPTRPETIMNFTDFIGWFDFLSQIDLEVRYFN